MERRVVLQRAAACSLFALALAACTTGFGAGGDGLDTMACPELAGGAMSGHFTADARANASLRAFVQASSDLMQVADRVEADVEAACRRMGHNLGVPESRMGRGVKGACGAVSAEIDAILREGVRADVKATFVPPECRVQGDAYARCAGQCDVRVDPGYVVAHCEPGKLSGRCEGVCGGTCEGACRGDCSGKCAARDAQGKCAGRCEGTCHGQCDATCHAKCEGTWKAPHCETDIKAPSADARCDASCKAHAEITAQCSEPKVDVHASVNTGRMGKLVATLRANLPALIRAEIAYGKRIVGDIKVLVDVSGDLPGIIGHAGAHAAACTAASADAILRAQASISVSVQASASVSGKVGAHGG